VRARAGTRTPTHYITQTTGEALAGVDRTTGAAKEMPLGHVFIAIDIAALTDVDQFKTAAGNFCRALRASGKSPRCL